MCSWSGDLTVSNTYLDNIETRTITTIPINPLLNLAPLTHDKEISVPGFCLNGSSAYGVEPADWSAYALSYYRDNNIMAVIDAMMVELTGSFKAQLHHPSSLPSVAGPIMTPCCLRTFSGIDSLELQRVIQ